MEKIISFLKVIYNFIIENLKAIGIVLAVVSVIAFCNDLTDEKNEYEQMEEVVEMWKEQLPSGHWAKRDDLTTFAYDMLADFGNMSKSMIDMYTLGMGQSGTAGEVASMALQQVDKDNERKFVLKNYDTDKKIRNGGTIKVALNESVKIKLFYDNAEVLLDFTEQQYIDAIGRLTNTRIAFSCTEDTNIAKIYDGNITGMQKGKTKLYICSSGYLWEYTIKVK